MNPRELRIIRKGKKIKTRSLIGNTSESSPFVEVTFTFGPGAIAVGPNDYSIIVSGLTNPLGLNKWVSIEVNLTHPVVEELYGTITNAIGVGTNDIIYDVSGANLTGYVIYNSAIIPGYPDTSSGSAPYTGRWNDAPGGVLSSNAGTPGLNPNGTWVFSLTNLGLTVGSVQSIILTFINP